MADVDYLSLSPMRPVYSGDILSNYLKSGKNSNMGPKYHLKFLTDMLLYPRKQRSISQIEASLTPSEKVRLDHYFKVKTSFQLPATAVERVPLFKKTLYSYDFQWCFWELGDPLKFTYEFGDVREVPPTPSFVKSRPISTDNGNSVLLPLETARHFTFVKDVLPFELKKNQAIFRGACYQPWRKAFMEHAIKSPLVDAGDTARRDAQPLHPKPFLTIKDQLRYKFIVSLEGNDVASNLKWAMNSNSVVLMPKPKFETWFCESFLVPNQHYAELQDDFSNLNDVIDDLLSSPSQCHEIAHEAKAYCEPFYNICRQYQLGALIMRKYHSLQDIPTLYRSI